MTKTPEQEIDALVQSPNVPAHAVVITDGDRIRHVSTTGGVTLETAFPLCSTAKILTALSVLKLARAGKLDIQADIRTYLPGAKIAVAPGDERPQVTLKHLLSHQSGLPDEDDVMLGVSIPTRKQYVDEFVPTLKSFAAPGDVFWYSNSGFHLAEHVAEVAAGYPFNKLLQSLVLDRIGVKPVQPGDTQRVRAQPAFGTPAAGVHLTVGGLARLAIVFANRGAVAEQIIEPEIFDAMTAHTADAVTWPTRYYGLGTVLEYWNGFRVVSHGGGMGAFGTYFSVIPERRLGVMAMFNHPAGYALTPQRLFGLLLPSDKGRSEAPAEPEVPALKGGIFQAASGDLFTVNPLDPNSVEVIKGEHRYALRRVSKQIFRDAEGGVTLGQVASGNGRYLSWNEYPIGLVSAAPLRRVPAKS